MAAGGVVMETLRGNDCRFTKYLLGFPDALGLYGVCQDLTLSCLPGE